MILAKICLQNYASCHRHCTHTRIRLKCICSNASETEYQMSWSSCLGQRYKDSYANRCETWQNIATRCSNIKSRNRMFSKKNWLTRQWTVPYVFRYLWSKEIILVSSHLKNIFRWMFRSKDWSSQYFKAGLGSTTHDLPWVSATIYSVLLGVLGTRFPVRRYSC